MFTHKLALMVGGAVVLGLVVASSGDAASAAIGRTNRLTFSGPIALPGVTLAGGTYTFQLLALHPDIVRVMSRDGSQVYFTGFTRQVKRRASLAADRTVTLAETPRGVAPRIQAWYPLGIATGHEFIYPQATR